MELRVALCQVHAEKDPGKNLRRLEDIVRRTDADLFVFPELYLSSYGGSLPKGFLDTAIPEMQGLCSERGCAVCVGAPVEDDGLRNSQFFITADDVHRYDKLHLARFGIYAENQYTAGTSLTMFQWKGMTFGMEVCYDIMFPEIHRAYALAGADVVISSAASAGPSRQFMERIGPARSLENTVYTVFLNNIGPCGDDKFWGGSCIYGPLGDMKAVADDGECVIVSVISTEEIARAREIRHHLEDLRRDIDWKV